MIVFMILAVSLNGCFANIGNAYSYSKKFDSLTTFYKELEEDETTIIWAFEMNPGEVMYANPMIVYHTESKNVIEYRINKKHAGLSYYTYVSISREESRMSGGQLFRGEYFDEEVIIDELIIRTKFTPASVYSGPMTIVYNFYFKKGEIGFYGEVVHVNEIPENYDKQAIIDYIIELYEQNTD